MNRLYLLGFTKDLKGVVFGRRADAKKGTYWVPVDDRFLSALNKLERTRRGSVGIRKAKRGSVTAPKSTDGRPLPPVGRSKAREGMPASEIQQLLREGRSVKSVADEAKVPIAWVQRLSEPVEVERDGVVQMAQRAYMPRPRLGQSGLPMGEAVRRNLQDRRASPETIENLDGAWDARAARSGGWRVSVKFNHRGARRVAEWQFHKGKIEIQPRNRLAGQLGWWAPEEALPEPDDDDEFVPDVEAEEEAPPAKPVRRKPAPKPAPRKATRRAKAPARRPKPQAKAAPRRVARKPKR